MSKDADPQNCPGLAKEEGQPFLFHFVKDNRYGFIDSSGNVIIEPKFDFARGFSEGLAYVVIAKKNCFIDITGTIVIETNIDGAFIFREGFAAVINKGKWGYIDRAGKVVIDFRFDMAWPFYEGLALVMIGDKNGYIDKLGNLVINLQYSKAWPFTEELACVMIGDKFGYIEKTGKIALVPKYSDASPFSEGLAAVKVGNKYCYINKKEEIIIDPKFDYAESFSEGVAVIRIGSKFGYIEKTGRVVVKPQFEYVESFSEGLAVFASYEKGEINGSHFVHIGKRGFIDKTGLIIIKPKYDYAGSFKGGLSEVHIGGGWGYIDKTERYVWSSFFKEEFYKTNIKESVNIKTDKNIWQQFKGMNNSQELLLEKAQILAPMLLFQVHSCLDTLINYPSDEGGVSVNKEVLRKVELEFVMFLLHVIDRYSFQYLGVEKRKIFMDALCSEVIRVLKPSCDSVMVMSQVQNEFMRLYNEKQVEYGKYQLWFPVKDEGAKGTLFWEFGKNVAKELGSEMSFKKIFKAHISIIPSIGALQLKELLW